MMGGRPGRDPGVPPQRHTLPVWVQTGSTPGEEEGRKGDKGEREWEKAKGEGKVFWDHGDLVGERITQS